MDRVRFGRALGYGARHAAKTLVAAADAATSADPRTSTKDAAAAPTRAETTEGTRNAARTMGAEAGARARAARRAAPQARAQARGVWKPLARFSGVLWLEVTGTFFTLIAVFVASGAWKLRGALHGPLGNSAAQKLYLHPLILLVFSYFAVSSFVRARRRERR